MVFIPSRFFPFLIYMYYFSLFALFPQLQLVRCYFDHFKITFTLNFLTFAFQIFVYLSASTFRRYQYSLMELTTIVS